MKYSANSIKSQAGKFAIRPLHLHPRNNHRLSLPRPQRPGDARCNYRGNRSPYIPRNLILRYTAPGELVLDQMMGSGTTLVECKLLGRRAVGVDINPDAVMVARNRLDFSYAPLDADYVAPEIKTYVGDARSLDLIEPESIDSSQPILLMPASSPIAMTARATYQACTTLLNSMMKCAGVECMRVLGVHTYGTLAIRGCDVNWRNGC